jgi:hypothetical protein
MCWKLCASRKACYTIREAKLDSYGRNRVGAFVFVHKSDFGCCGPLFGGELALQKAQLDPAGEPISFSGRYPPSLFGFIGRIPGVGAARLGLEGASQALTCFPTRTTTLTVRSGSNR